MNSRTDRSRYPEYPPPLIQIGDRTINIKPAVLRRGAAHILIGLSIGISGYFLPRVLFLSLLGTATALFLLIEFIRFKSPTTNAWFLSFFKLVLRESEVTHLTGASYMLLTALITFLVFERDIAVTSVCFLAVGDALATTIGRNNVRKKLTVETFKGNAACLAGCLAIGFIVHYAGLKISTTAAIIGAVVATITEAIPLPVNDNLTIPIAAGLVMSLVGLVL